MTSGLVLGILVLTAGVAVYGGRVGAAALAFVSIVWLRANQSMEGEVFFAVTPHHGLTAADMGGLAGLALALLIWCRPHGR